VNKAHVSDARPEWLLAAAGSLELLGPRHHRSPAQGPTPAKRGIEGSQVGDRPRRDKRSDRVGDLDGHRCYSPPFSILAQVSRNPTVRLKIRRPEKLFLGSAPESSANSILFQ